MKIRIGFVSNSSSSSFCLYGVSISFSELKEKYYFFEDYIINNNLTVKTDYENEYAYIGCPYTEMRDDETYGEFKKSVKKKLKKIGIDVDPSHIIETSYS